MKIMNESHGATYLVCRHVFVLFAGRTYSFLSCRFVLPEDEASLRRNALVRRIFP